MPLTPTQVARIEYLLYECEDDASFTREFEKLETSEELHEFASQFNWDCGFSELDAVLAHPMCDRGTALMIYWLAEPVYYVDFASIEEVPDVNREGYRFVMRVRDLLTQDVFQENRIPFDPQSVMSIGQRRKIARGCEIPPELAVPNC